MRLLKIVEKVIEFGFYALFFITPFLFNPSRSIPSFELFEFNKMMFVYLLTTIIMTAWLGRMILLKKKLFKRTPLDLPLFLFVISQIFATIFSIDRHVSFFGYYSRFHGGLLSTIAYALLFYAFVSNRNLINLQKLIKGALISGAVVAIYGILERFGIDAHMWVQDVQARVFSTLGQPNWLAALLAILLPIGIFFYSANDAKSLNNKKFQLPASNIYLTLTIIFYICLLFTKSRSGFLGFWITHTLFWGILWWRKILHSNLPRINLRSLMRLAHEDESYFVKTFLSLNIMLLILNFFIKTPFSQYNQVATIEIIAKEKKAEEKAPIGSSIIDVGITDSGKIRQIVWSGAIDIIKNYPLFGTGPETFAYAYYKYRPTSHNLTSEWDFLYNRAHNEFLNIAATSGLIGLVSYLFLILCTLYIGAKKIIKETNITSVNFLVALIAAYLSIQITNFFGFSVVVVGLYFIFLPAFIATPNDTKEEQNKITSFNLGQKIMLLGIFLLMFFVIYKLALYWIADSYYARANNLRRQESLSEAYQFSVAATNLRPNEPVYHDERATISVGLATLAFQNQEATPASEFAQEAISESGKALEISPQNVNFWKSRTRILYEFSAFAPEFLTSALESIKIAYDLAPTDAKIAYNVAVLHGELGQDDEAVKMLETTIALKPDYRDAYIAASLFYEMLGKNDKAREKLQQVLERINPDDQEVKERMERLK